MNRPSRLVMIGGKCCRQLGAATGAVLIGVFFFLIIIGAFGMQLAIGGLLMFVFAAALAFY